MYFNEINRLNFYKILLTNITFKYLPSIKDHMIEYGCGNICIIEENNILKFYVIDRASIFDYKEFNNIKDLIDHLLVFYLINGIIDDDKELKELLYNYFNLTNNKKFTL